MLRRTAIKNAILSLFALPIFGGKSRATAPPAEGPALIRRGSDGKALARVYRQDERGNWQQIDIMSIKPGDKILCVGITGGRLWQLGLVKLGKDGVQIDLNDGGPMVKPEQAVILAGPYYDRFDWVMKACRQLEESEKRA